MVLRASRFARARVPAFSAIPSGRQSALRTLLPVLLSTAVCTPAAELAIEAKPFEVVCSLNARVMPAAAVPLLRVDALAWQTFSIRQLARHGSAVKKGELLIEFDSRAIDLRIDELRRQLRSNELDLAAAQDAHQRLAESAPHLLEAAKREAAIAREALDHFQASGRETEEEEARHSIERARQSLENEQEELRQLQQMYEADDLTEDTEEIILTRQKHAVAHADWILRHTRLSQMRQLEVLLPRKAESLSHRRRDAALALHYAEREIPRSVEQAGTRVEALKATLEQSRQNLADLEQDRKLFRMVAEVDGVFYHGAVANGRWTTGELLRNLKLGGSVPLHSPFATLIPQGTPHLLVSHTDAAVARQLREGLTGIATLAGTEVRGAEQSALAARVTRCELIPDDEGAYQVEIDTAWPKELPVATGQPALVRLVVYHKPEAVTVPATALHFGAKGWSVELKLADGKTERRPVIRGPQSGDEVEILSGLEVGQVIITP